MEDAGTNPIWLGALGLFSWPFPLQAGNHPERLSAAGYDRDWGQKILSFLVLFLIEFIGVPLVNKII